MKKVFLCCCIILTIVSAGINLFIPRNFAFAEDSTISDEEKIEEAEKELEEKIEENLNELDLNELEIYLNEINERYSGLFDFNIKSMLAEIIEGNFENGPKEIFEYMLNLMFGNILNMLPIFLSVIVISLLCGMLSNLSSGFIRQQTSNIINFICYAAVIVLIMGVVVDLIKNTANLINDLTGFMNAVFPVLLTLMAALGGVVSVSVYQPLMLILSTTITGIISSLVLPLFIGTIIFTIIGNLSDSVRLGKLTKVFKSTGEWVLGIIFSVFLTFLSIQGITGATADGITLKSAKFAISSYVPILGGYLSDGFDLMLASMVLIKNSLGLTVVIILLGIIILPLMQVIMFSLCLKITSAIIEPVSGKRISNFLYDLSKNFTIVIAAVLGIAFLFFIMVMLIIYTCNFGVI